MDETRIRWLQGLRPPDARLLDAFLALLLTTAQLTSHLLAKPSAGFHTWDHPGVVLAVLSTALIGLLHVVPLPTFAAMLACSVALGSLGYQLSFWGTLASLYALFIIALSTSYRRSLIAASLAGASLISLFIATNAFSGLIAKLGTWGWYSAVYVLGIVIKTYRDSVAEARGRAAFYAADREARAREAVADERARLARELHDVVGHALNVVVLQAGGAQRVLDTKPQLARQALASIEATGRQALQDVERMLGILRSSQKEATGLQAPPSLAHLPALVAQVSQAGLPAELAVRGTPVDVPASLDLSAYRIVQEALTNALKHAGSAHAHVVLTYTATALEIEVTDSGRGSALEHGETGGRGIPGMRERVSMFGGDLAVGPRPEGGFRVWAKLPFGEEEP